MALTTNKAPANTPKLKIAKLGTYANWKVNTAFTAKTTGI